MAGLVILLALPFLFGPAAKTVAQTRDHLPSIRNALKRREVRTGLLVAAVYVAAQKWGSLCSARFWSIMALISPPSAH